MASILTKALCSDSFSLCLPFPKRTLSSLQLGAGTFHPWGAFSDTVFRSAWASEHYSSGASPPPITLNSHCVNQPLTQTMTIDGHTPWKPDLLIQPGGWASPPTFHVFFFLQKPILDHSLSRLTTMYCYEFCPSWPTLKYNSSKTYWKWNSHLNSWGAEVESH